MKPGVPWSVKGIEAEAREAAKFAARRSGMTLGEWLNSVILDQADDKDDLERRYIALILEEVRGSQVRAASILGISRKALWEKRKRYGLS